MVTIADFEASAPTGGRAVKLRQAARERGDSRPRRVQASGGASLASISDRIWAARHTSTDGRIDERMPLLGIRQRVERAAVALCANASDSAPG